MKRKRIGTRIIALVMALLVGIPASVWSILAAEGDFKDVETGLVSNSMNTNDTISLPIKIYDYEADGMLFEFAQENEIEVDKTFNPTSSIVMEGQTVISDGYQLGTHTLKPYDSSISVEKFYAKDVAGGVPVSFVKLLKGSKTITGYKDWVGNQPTLSIGGLFDDLPANNKTLNAMRYITIVYRTNIPSGDIYLSVGRYTDSAGWKGANSEGSYTGAQKFTWQGNITHGLNNTYKWTYAVYDLKKGSLASNETLWNDTMYGSCTLYMSFPLQSGQSLDISRIACFSDKDLATKYGEYFITEGGNRGDNRAFGLLRGSRNVDTDLSTKDAGTVKYAAISDLLKTVNRLNTYGTNATPIDLSTRTPIDSSTNANIGYKLLGEFATKGIANIGLLESSLSKDGYPVYKKEVVEYLAGLLQNALTIPKMTVDANGKETGWTNYDYVQGTPSALFGNQDLATALRGKITGVGSYNEAASKGLVGTWEQVSGKITTYHDAAYFLLNSIFVAGSYNEVKTDYDYLVLNKAIDADTGETTYVFDAAFTDNTNLDIAESAVKYDPERKTISNSSAVSKKFFYFSDNANDFTTFYPFLPIQDKNTDAGQTKSLYYQDDGVAGLKDEMDTYKNRNFNYVLVSEGEFVYNKKDELFFEFQGDDDVYLFINGELVLDLGSAHGIDGYRFELNKYVEEAEAGTLGSGERNNNLKLVEGENYSFRFYYMERHGYGANMRINTNIRVIDPSMDTTKTAYQEGVQIEHGGVVDKNKPVEYGYAITNTGIVNLYDFTFEDAQIGVTIDWKNGLIVTDPTKVRDARDGTLEANDLTAILRHPNYADTVVNFKNSEELKSFLKNLAGETIESGAGLWAGSTLEIRGIYYNLSNEQKEAGFFDNKVKTSAMNNTDSKIIYGSATMRIYTDAALVFYEWKDKLLNVKPADLADQLNIRIKNLTANNLQTLEIISDEGTPITDGPITINSNKEMQILYDTTGPKVFNVKLTYSCDVDGDSNGDEIQDSYNPTKDSNGNYKFGNAHGHTFTVNGKDGTLYSEYTMIYNSSYYKQSGTIGGVHVHLRTISDEDTTRYQVVRVASDNDGKAEIAADIKDNDIVLAVHSGALQPGVSYDGQGAQPCYNWKNRVAALALVQGDVVTVNAEKTSVTVIGGEYLLRGVVNVTDVKDSVYVLDYGLSANLLENQELFKNDSLNISGRLTETEILAISSQKPDYATKTDNNIDFIDESTKEEGNSIIKFENDAYDGTFILDKTNQSLKYTPTKIMDDIDKVYIAILVREASYDGDIILGNVNISKEVQMYKSISVLPATIVYYEDDFPAIIYKEGGKNEFTPIGSGSKDLTQSVDQDQEYGQDDVYKDQENAEMSGNSLKQITIKDTGEVATFEFTGTGFELIARTDAKDSATIIVQVKDSSGKAVKTVPVITEFDHDGNGGEEAIYQVPVIRVNGLEHGKYTVVITGVPARDYDAPYVDGKPVIIPTTLYLDGIRIFYSLTDKNDNYIDSENGAIFQEIRNLIVNGQAAVAQYDGAKMEVSTGTITWTENRNGENHDNSTYEGNQVSSVNDYLMLGPNNEVYMDGDYEGSTALVFYVTEDDSAEAHNLQIAIHAIDKGLFYGVNSLEMDAFLAYGIQSEEGYEWAPLVNIYSATEQYYTIDYTKCPQTDNGYQVAIMVDSGMVSYTSLKYNGLKLGNMGGEKATIQYENGILKDLETGEELSREAYPAFSDLSNLLATDDFLGGDIVIEDVTGDNTEAGSVKEGILYQERNNSDIRLIAYVDKLEAYSSVSFVLTLNGIDSRELKCTTAYEGLIANNIIKTTEDIYGKDGYFVTYTINGYIEAFGGQEVTIKAIYTTVTGETRTETRTVTIK